MIDLTVVCDSANSKILPDEHQLDDRFKSTIEMWDLITWDGAYYHGYREPNYPLPAIRERVNIFGDVVIIWSCHTNRAVAVYRNADRLQAIAESAQ